MGSESTGIAADDRNLYAAPQAHVAEPDARTRSEEFYVVSKTKFFLLYLMTLGLYQIYWFYRHWAVYRRYHPGTSIWPVPRAIFAIFFTHSLTGRIEDRLGKLRSGLSWSPGALATAFVVLQIASNILDRLSWRMIGSPLTDIASLVIIMPMALVLWSIQEAANHACGQPDGASNRDITGANIVWCVLGGVFWLLVLAGLLLPDSGEFA